MAVIDVTAAYPIPLVWPRLALDLKRVDAIAIHHTVTFFLSPSATVAEERAHISMIHVYHKSKGWGGFAYHLISFPSGRVYLVVRLTQWGTHVKGENDHLDAIVVAGDFTDRVPVLAQQEGVAEGIRLIYATLGREVSIRPHRAWGGTACPGNAWQSWVPGLTALVEEDDMTTPEEVREIMQEELAPIKAELSTIKAKIGKTYNQVNVKAGAVLKGVVDALGRLRISLD